MEVVNVIEMCIRAEIQSTAMIRQTQVGPDSSLIAHDSTSIVQLNDILFVA
jgi:hypothetical protein